MTGHARDLRYGPAHIEQSRHAFVAKIMEVQVLNAEHLASASEGRGDRVGREWNISDAVRGIDSTIADASGVRSHHILFPTLSPGCFISRTSTRLFS